MPCKTFCISGIFHRVKKSFMINLIGMNIFLLVCKAVDDKRVVMEYFHYMGILIIIVMTTTF